MSEDSRPQQPAPPAYQPGAGWQQAPPPPPPPPPHYITPSVSELAIASMVLGIVWIWGLGSILAVIFGHIALRQIRRSNGWKTGRGMAIAGVVLGYVGLAILPVVVAAMIATANDDGDDSDDRFGDDAHLDQLYNECEAGDMGSCDDLWLESPPGSDYEEFGDTCGDRVSSSGEFCEGRVEP